MKSPLTSITILVVVLSVIELCILGTYASAWYDTWEFWTALALILLYAVPFLVVLREPENVGKLRCLLINTAIWSTITILWRLAGVLSDSADINNGWVSHCGMVGWNEEDIRMWSPYHAPGKDKIFLDDDECEQYAGFWIKFRNWTSWTLTTAILVLVLYVVHAEYKKQRSAAKNDDESYQKPLMDQEQTSGNQIQ